LCVVVKRFETNIQCSDKDPQSNRRSDRELPLRLVAYLYAWTWMNCFGAHIQSSHIPQVIAQWVLHDLLNVMVQMIRIRQSSRP
jgi:hypothetical protein